MLNAIQEGIFNSSTKQRLDKLEETKGDLEVRILQQEMVQPVLTPDRIRFWLYKFQQLDIGNPEHQQKLIDTFVNAVYLYDDKIVFTYNGRQDTETVTLSDIKRSDFVSFYNNITIRPLTCFCRLILRQPICYNDFI